MARSIEHFFLANGKRTSKHPGRQRGAFRGKPDSTVRAKTDDKRNLPVLKPTKPFGGDKLSVPDHDVDVRGVDNLEKALKRLAMSLGRGASPIRQDDPANWKDDSLERRFPCAQCRPLGH